VLIICTQGRLFTNIAVLAV